MKSDQQIHRIFRQAKPQDIPQIQIVRNAVKENRLSDPGLVTDHDVEEFICRRGKGWVCVSGNEIVGFAIADLQDENIWALFVLPEAEKKGIGKTLHDMMLDWYFAQSKNEVWLGTAPVTRAFQFYKKAGWTETGKHGALEVKFVMTAVKWKELSTP